MLLLSDCYNVYSAAQLDFMVTIGRYCGKILTVAHIDNILTVAHIDHKGLYSRLQSGKI